MTTQRQWFSCVAAGVILAGVTVDRAFFHDAPANADPYHERIRNAVKPEVFSLRAGSWFGVEGKVTTGSAAILHPNVAFSRAYTDLTTGQKATFLLVQCRDARDLIGHYPPNCYQAAGWTLASHQPADWKLGDLTLHGTMYTFTQSRGTSKSAMNIFNVMILPNGDTAPDMNGVYTIARDRKMRYFGAAQIQILTNTDFPEGLQHQVIDSILATARPVIDAIRAGVPQ